MTESRIDPDLISAGIVTYNPDLDLLRRNVLATAEQVREVFIFDNGSENSADLSGAVGGIDKVVIIEAGENLGIAAALNRIAENAAKAGYKWLLTLDQDSVPTAGMVSRLAKYASVVTPMVTPHIVDRNKLTPEQFNEIGLPPVQYYTRAASKGAITSGALLSLEVLNIVGGFDERFFIDYVDYDLNARLLKSGYQIARVNETYLSHQVGDARETWLVTPRKSMSGNWQLERFYSFGHSPMRCYYKARNRILYSKKHWRFIGFANEGVMQIPQQIALTLIFERQRGPKLRSFLRGIRDGLAMNAES